jgi:hypothetical protein
MARKMKATIFRFSMISSNKIFEIVKSESFAHPKLDKRVSKTG